MRWTLVALLGGLVAFISVTAWQVVEAAHRSDPNRPAGAAVVMGAAQYSGVPSGALAGRLDRAAELYHQGLVGQIVVTGGNQPGDRTTEGMTGFVYLRERGVPESALLVENGSINTWEQLLATALIVDQHDIHGVIVVSDPYHNRRVLDIADQLGLDAQVAPADSHVSRSQLARETAAVAVGRVIGYRRLSELAR
ncbi:MAG: YdcF family protein [Acidimicrobiales bacterium]